MPSREWRTSSGIGAQWVFADGENPASLTYGSFPKAVP